MHSFTVEICTAEDDPYDRTLSVMVKGGSTIELVRSLRLRPSCRIGEVLLELDRLILAWCTPALPISEHLHDTWDSVERKIGFGPFD